MKKSSITTNTQPDLTLAQRVLAPTPSFFKKVRTIGVILGVIGASLLAAPVALPAVVVSIGGYLTLAGSIISAVAQTATQGE